jgi:hypothetical protein
VRQLFGERGPEPGVCLCRVGQGHDVHQGNEAMGVDSEFIGGACCLERSESECNCNGELC